MAAKQKFIALEEENIQYMGQLKPSRIERCSIFFGQNVDYFITPITFNFFRRFNTSTLFLHSYLDVGNELLDFLKGQGIVKRFKVANDTAERGVKLVRDYDASLTKDKEKNQYAL